MKKEELDSTIVLTDEQGNEVCFEMIDVIEYEGESYAILFPVEEPAEGESDDLVILQIRQGKELDEFIGIDDEGTVAAVFAAFQTKMEQYLAEFDVIE